MKYEWRKANREINQIKSKPCLIDVPAQSFIMIDGKGNPNAADFSERVGALYSLAYAIKMNYKKTAAEQEFTDFTVYPLEGIWQQEQVGELIKEELIYTIMIGQPDFITGEMVKKALEQVRVKKPNPLYDEIRFEEMTEGECVAMLHLGPFDEEPHSFAKMDAFCQNHQLTRISHTHREIYLNNLNRTDPSKLETILRYRVQKNQ
ncbi:GyrI-like domain-containing protein [Streptococcus sanguinis]|uniref:GyrI-like domain-containing protein n=1 Tax=Streptococcus sanguinis TaxID=1305 RepID=UPI001CBDD0B0|nr:GyrI-like domain-containing protein [Streptococcus sanguinis]MBZ2038935.1 GyrI-like domain-containing protein [Streptococcus sanguinis]MBZ2069129.1 GyrI-like domain-containing protein [Streptococcus sanguinis]MBZ2071230.1 GyrI-like domain-containing protein [Streptococcus sanguinis]MBZ2073106.1 GyrI-like domain-containing protein [Streptococcus sanguinis]MBZ2080942.1 GyrI-like domain-containing protein [Streptococcus sanguinis]